MSTPAAPHRSPIPSAAPGDLGAARDVSSAQSAPCKILLDYVVPDTTDMILVDAAHNANRARSEQVILDHKGPVRLQLHHDGSFTCDPQENQAATMPSALAATAPSAPSNNGLQQALMQHLQEGGRLLFACTMATGVTAGYLVAVSQLVDTTTSYTPLELFRAVSETTSCAIAGILTGVVMGPLIAVNSIAKSLARPVALAAAGHLGRLLLSNLGGARRLARRVQSGDVLAQLEAVQKVAARAARNDGFRAAFLRHGGVEGLLRLLAANPQGAAASLVAHALAGLVAHAGCKDAVVRACGVGLVAQLLDHHDPLTVAHAVQALAHLSSHALAHDHLREQNVVPKLVRLLQQGGPSLPYDTPHHCVQALLHLAADPANRAAMVQANAVAILASLLRDVSVLSEVKAVAVALLHVLARSNPDVAQALADLDDLATVLQRLLSALGPLWHPAKADIHALLTTLSRTPASMLGGDAPILVCPPPRLSPDLLARGAAPAGGPAPRRVGSSVSSLGSSSVVLPGADEEHPIEGSGLGGVGYVTLS